MQLPIKGLVTGVGSLPFLEADPALKLIWETVPLVPHWPQLPLAGEDEGFSVQYLQSLVQLGMVTEREGLYFDLEAEKWLERLTEFYGICLAALEGDGEALEQFAFPPQAARGFYAFLNDLKQGGARGAHYIKGQLSGPLTVGFQLKSPNKRPCYYDPQLRDILVKNLTLHGVWQVRTLRQFNLPVIMTVDDPGLYAFGLSSHVTLSREEIIADLNGIYEAIQAEGAAAGTHVCAGMDWTILLESKVEIINFDAYAYFDSLKVYPEQLKTFLQRGGVLAWGIVPTSDRVLEESAESLTSRLEGYIEELQTRGISRDLLLSQSMFTPSCGTGTLTPVLAEKIYRILSQIGERVRGHEFKQP